MPPLDRLLWRLAGRLADGIARHFPPQNAIPLDHSDWLWSRRLVAQLKGISGRNWNAASEHLRRQLLMVMKRLQDHLGAVIRDMPAGARIPQPPSQRLIYEELVAASDEFEDLDFDLRKQTLSVTTSEITLEGVYFGQFQILLNFSDLSRHDCYRVIAKAPHYSASRSDVTHPHVLDDRLCEGDAEAPLRCALRTGRLCDFFQIIQQTLQTYNSESAYSALDGWDDAIVCHACGDSISEYASHYCDTCQDDTCEDCSCGCPHCGNSACDYCISSCPACEENSCASCLRPCGRCGKRRCPDCLTETYCEECHATVFPTNETNASSATTLSIPAAPAAPVFADRLGQAPVPAGSG